MLQRPAILLTLLLFAPMSAFPDTPQYLFINVAPGMPWNASNPDSFSADLIHEIKAALDCPANPHLHWGVSFVFDYFRYDIQQVRQSIERLLALSLETQTPILINLDGQNWWGARPDLWNWWDPEKPGYEPKNRFNVEWFGWSPDQAVKIGWRNWGSQIRVLPQPNLASPAFLRANQEALRLLLPPILEWSQSLSEKERRLFGGIKLGHEASIGVNAYYYPNGNHFLERYPKDASHDPTEGYQASEGWHGGLQRLGYAAAKSAGIKDKGLLTREDVSQIVQHYLAALCKVAHTMGFPREKVFSHQGGVYAPWEKHLLFEAALNPYCVPGWSLYFTNPHDIGNPIEQVLSRRADAAWAAVEWWWSGEDKAAWLRNFEQSLGYKNCRLLCIYNWNCGLSLKKDPHGVAAIRQLFEGWKSEQGQKPLQP